MARKKTRKGRVSRSSGRFGARYGRRDRKLVADLEKRTNSAHVCAFCDQPYVGRVGTGIWECSKCGNKFAGGAFLPETSVGKAFKNAMRNALKDRSEQYTYDFLNEEDEDDFDEE
ncbi:MAG: 50S ribosomal protein L37ae [Methanosarcinaceae archaeon]|nr:50S ribosomal protein L37ae [Methanosarcinaceae archaeon]